MIKKVFGVFLLFVFCAMVLGGCSTTTYHFTENSNGSLSVHFEVSIDEDIVIENGGTKAVVNDLLNKTKELLTNYNNAQKSKYLLKVETTFPSPSTVKNFYLNDAVVSTVEKVGNTVYYEITFYNSEVYYFYYGITEKDLEESENDLTTKDYWLYKKVIQNTTTIYSNNLDTTSGEQNIVAYYKNEYYNYIKTTYSEELANKLADYKLVYAYTTSNTKLRSNADKTEKGTDYVTYVWYIDKGNTQREVVFYRIVPNVVSFYIIGFGATGLFILIYIIVSLVKEKKKKKRNELLIKQFKEDLNSLDENLFV